jgi:hypothetical protein
MKRLSLLALLLLALPAGATEFDVTFRHWDNRSYRTTLPAGGAVLAWPGREVVVTPRIEAGVEVQALTSARRRGRAWWLRPTEHTDRIWFRFRDTRGGRTWDTGILILVPRPAVVDAHGMVMSPPAATGFPLGLYPEIEDVPSNYRVRAKALSSRFYVVVDTSLPISRNYTIGMFLSKMRPERVYGGRAHLLALDYGLVDLLERITARWRTLGFPGRARIESPFRTPDYNNAAEAGRAEFSLHMYGSAADVISSVDDDHLHDDIDRNGDRDLDDLLPLAQALERSMRASEIPKGGLGVYHYIHYDGRDEEFTIHVDLRGRIAKWGSVYDGNTVEAASDIEW